MRDRAAKGGRFCLFFVYVNELMANNQTTLTDPVEPGESPDWFELYNYGTVVVNLNGLFLSDDPTNPTKNPITQNHMKN